MFYSKKLKKIKLIKHCFFSRKDGYSKGIYKGLNCGRGSKDNKKDILKNLKHVSKKMLVNNKNLVLMHQTHSNKVIEIKKNNFKRRILSDAMITKSKDLALGVVTADCVPILLFDKHAKIVGCIHAGWRGIANGIIEQTLSNVEGLRCAAIGPCISVDAYEVGAEVVDGITCAGVPRDVFVQERQPRPHVDLKAAARFQLQRAGVPNIDVLPHCTFLDENFHSYRRDGNGSGRLAGFIGFVV